MLGIKVFIFLWILIGAVFCWRAFTGNEKIKELVNNSSLLETTVAMMYTLISSPYWIMYGIIKTLFKKG